MAELDSMQTVIMQVAIKAATVAVMALREADTGPTTGTNILNVEEAHIPRQR